MPNDDLIVHPQKVLNIAFQLLDRMYINPEWVKSQTREQVMEWAAQIYRECGVPNEPCGSSWGLIPNKNQGIL